MIPASRNAFDRAAPGFAYDGGNLETPCTCADHGSGCAQGIPRGQCPKGLGASCATGDEGKNVDCNTAQPHPNTCSDSRQALRCANSSLYHRSRCGAGCIRLFVLRRHYPPHQKPQISDVVTRHALHTRTRRFVLKVAAGNLACGGRKAAPSDAPSASPTQSTPTTTAPSLPNPSPATLPTQYVIHSRDGCTVLAMLFCFVFSFFISPEETLTSNPPRCGLNCDASSFPC